MTRVRPLVESINVLAGTEGLPLEGAYSAWADRIEAERKEAAAAEKAAKETAAEQERIEAEAREEEARKEAEANEVLDAKNKTITTDKSAQAPVTDKSGEVNKASKKPNDTQK